MLSKAPIRLIAVDLDGTVVRPDFTISDRVAATLRAAAARGLYVTIATGRGPESARPFVDRIGVNAPVVCTQGGLVYDVREGRELHRMHLARGLACELISFARAHPHWHPVVYIHDHIWIEERRFEEDFYRRMLVDEEPNMAPDLCAALGRDDADKILFVIEPRDAPKAREALRKVLDGRATVVQSHAQFVEVNPLGADKGAGLARVAAHLGLERDAVLAIGDQENDVPMLHWAGIGVAMGNASPAAIAAADWIAPGIDEDGAAIAIEKFALEFGHPERSHSLV